ncbi:MAG: pantetheine-phosphate adenylyltransferase, partial [bacterium]
RAVSDFDYEFQLALANRKLAPLVETIFLLPDERFVYLNSTLVKSIARYNGKLDEFVPPVVKRMLKERFLR